MKQTDITGKVQTVLGIIDANDLGITLPHEHLLTDLSVYFVEPTAASEKGLAHQPITLENLWWVRAHQNTHLDNMKLLDEQLAIKEALLYKRAGGDTMVELSNIGLSRDPLGLARIARATNLNIIMGSGYYVKVSHPPELAAQTEEELTERIVRDIMVGVGDTRVRAGIIGEIGVSAPLEDNPSLDVNERKVLRACAVAQRHTGAAIYIHQIMSEGNIISEIIKTLDDAGADLSRTIIGHCSLSGFSETTFHKLADAGCYLAFDTMGHAPWRFTGRGTGKFFDRPSDVWRINKIKWLIDEGYLNHILISQDVCYNQCRVAYGGLGYAHILRSVVPWMREIVSDEQIHTIMMGNPKRLLTFAPVKE